MEFFKKCYLSRFLTVLLITILLPSFLCLAYGQPEGYLLIYEVPRAYPDSEWVDSRALYMKEDLDAVYFYVKFYGPMPSTPWGWRRQMSVLIDSDKDPRTAERHKEIGVDYVISVFITGDASVLMASLLRWNETMKDFQEVGDLKSSAVIDPRLDYVEVRVDKKDIEYTSRGFDFYAVTTGEWCHSGVKPWLEEFSYTIDSVTRDIRVDGEAGDWGGVHPLITLDFPQDVPQHFLVSKIYVANDNENLYLRLDTFQKPRVTVDSGEILRELVFFIDSDNNDASGDVLYRGAEIYINTTFFSRQVKSSSISYYVYTGGKKEWYDAWILLSSSDSSSDFDQIFELQIPLAYLNVTFGRRIGIFIPWGLCQVLERVMGERGALSYPPLGSTTISTMTTQTYATPSTYTTYTEKTTTTFTQLFSVTDLKIYPDVVKIGGRTTISVNVRNFGNVRGSYEVLLRVNGSVVNGKTVTLEPGQLIKVEFRYSPGREGTYYIEVDGLTGTLKAVKEVEHGDATLYMMIILLVIALLVLAFMISRRRKRVPSPPPPL